MQVPHYNETINKIRVGSYTSIIFTAIIFVVLSFVPIADSEPTPTSLQKTLSIVTWAGVVPVFGLGWLLARQRLLYFNVKVLDKYRRVGGGGGGQGGARCKEGRVNGWLHASCLMPHAKHAPMTHAKHASIGILEVIH